MDEFKVPTLPPPGATSRTEKKSNEATKSQPSAEISENNEQPKQTKQPNQQQQQQACPYKCPWSAPPSDQEQLYKFEVLKSGQIIEEVTDLQKQANWKFGRFPGNDIVLLHPTISRYHAVLQYRPAIENTSDVGTKEPSEGWYIYDLDSTHGTFLNKQRIPSRVYVRIRVGHMLRLGASTRSYLLQGPVDDEEPESEMSVTELREQRVQQQETAAAAKRKAAEAAEERLQNEGIDWGMGEDADEETDLTHNPYASTNNEELFLDDPKKTLRGYFEREDIPLEYKCDEMSTGCFVCRVELPIDDMNGRPIIAEVVHKGRKKECVVQCALEACRILDRHGVLRQANQEPSKRRAKVKDSDSDDDEFWDRTGDIARRKQRKANSNASVTLTYDDLVKQEAEIATQLEQVEADITEYHSKQKRVKEQEQAQDSADLDSFMEHLKEDVSQLDKVEIKKLRLEEQRLKAERLKIQRLIKIAKPYELPFTSKITSTINDKCGAPKRQLPMIGKRNQFSKFKVVKLPTPIITSNKTYASDEEEMEDENEQLLEKAKMETDPEATGDEYLSTLDSRLEQQTSKEEVETKLPKVKGPALLPPQTESEDPLDSACQEVCEVISETVIDSTENTVSNSQTEVSSSPPQAVSSSQGEDNESNAKKRHRQRLRQRNKRQEVDIDELDEHESSEKYAKWIPPQNQTGDGITELNEKYGY